MVDNKILKLAKKIRRSKYYEDRLEYDPEMLSETYEITPLQGKKLYKYLKELMYDVSLRNVRFVESLDHGGEGWTFFKISNTWYAVHHTNGHIGKKKNILKRIEKIREEDLIEELNTIYDPSDLTLRKTYNKKRVFFYEDKDGKNINITARQLANLAKGKRYQKW